ncbi:hypothetical protein SK128_002478 [Halocaridina rubra]|uniref:Uncharacterized protein n=1 Tax=Halocaridina rubra TaxID=373956 RepID=A0AAN8WH74_HALRR
MNPGTNNIFRTFYIIMGAALAKEAVPLAIRMTPAIIGAIRGSDGNRRHADDRVIIEALEAVQRNRNDIDQLMQNQAQLTEAIVMLVQRLEATNNHRAVEYETGNQINGRTRGSSSIRITMDLPEDPQEHDDALLRFWTTIRDRATDVIGRDRQQLEQTTDSNVSRLCMCFFFF